MEHPKIFETIGYIVKVETLTTVKYNILKNTLVLESLEPFPGYHGQHPPVSFKPRILYLVTQDEHTFEEIAMKSKDIGRFFRHRFDGTPAEINIINKTFFAIRVRFLESFELIPELQLYYQDEGVRFLKIRQIESPAMIKVNRYFLVEELEDGIYSDLTEAEQYYVELPKRFIWKAFESITMTVKNNLDNSNFDAAQGLMYRYSGPVNLVRIWDKNNSLERSRAIRNKYLQVIQSYP